MPFCLTFFFAICTGLSSHSFIDYCSPALPTPLLFVAHNLHIVQRHVTGLRPCQSLFQLTLNGEILVERGVKSRSCEIMSHNVLVLFPNTKLGLWSAQADSSTILIV